MFFIGNKQIKPSFSNGGDSSDIETITAKNLTGNVINKGDKVWVDEYDYAPKNKLDYPSDGYLTSNFYGCCFINPNATNSMYISTSNNPAASTILTTNSDFSEQIITTSEEESYNPYTADMIIYDEVLGWISYYDGSNLKKLGGSSLIPQEYIFYSYLNHGHIALLSSDRNKSYVAKLNSSGQIVKIMECASGYAAFSPVIDYDDHSITVIRNAEGGYRFYAIKYDFDNESSTVISDGYYFNESGIGTASNWTPDGKFFVQSYAYQSRQYIRLYNVSLNDNILSITEVISTKIPELSNYFGSTNNTCAYVNNNNILCILEKIDYSNSTYPHYCYKYNPSTESFERFIDISQYVEKGCSPSTYMFNEDFTMLYLTEYDPNNGSSRIRHKMIQLDPTNGYAVVKESIFKPSESSSLGISNAIISNNSLGEVSILKEETE